MKLDVLAHQIAIECGLDVLVEDLVELRERIEKLEKELEQLKKEE